MSCKCGSDRIMSVCGKTSDMCFCSYDGTESDSYVPKGIVIGEGGYGDYLEFDFCLDCGRIQGKFPISDTKVKKAIEEA